eukprot:m.264100 g.264100  ORF g.264100 m.264100 type:complete len:458 (+) comp40463_c1_seq1:253-1626(+)
MDDRHTNEHRRSSPSDSTSSSVGPSPWRKKRMSTFATSALAFFFGGVEYAVVIPTLWSFLDSMNATYGFFGLTFASFSIGALISGPIVGALSDKYRHPKVAFLVACAIEVAANLLYMCARSKYWILASRFVAGGAFGAIETTLLSYQARTTSKRNRTALFAVVLAARQSGLLIGPAFNVALCRLHFALGRVKIDAFTSPGLFMSILWTLLGIISVFLFFDLPEANRELSPSPPTKDETSAKVEDCLANTGVFTKILNCLKEEYVVLFAANFIHYYNQCAFEATIVPLCKHLLKWSEIPISIVYCVAAAEGLLCYVIVRIASRRISDRWLLVIGLVIQTFGLVWYILFIPRMQPLEKPQFLSKNVFLFLVPGAAIIFGIPFLGVAAVSLISKLTKHEFQGVVLGLFRGAQKVGLIIGPLWGGALLDSLYIMFGVMLSVQGLVATLLFLSFSKLKQIEQ